MPRKKTPSKPRREFMTDDFGRKWLQLDCGHKIMEQFLANGEGKCRVETCPNRLIREEDR